MKLLFFFFFPLNMTGTNALKERGHEHPLDIWLPFLTLMKSQCCHLKMGDIHSLTGWLWLTTRICKCAENRSPAPALPPATHLSFRPVPPSPPLLQKVGPHLPGHSASRNSETQTGILQGPVLLSTNFPQTTELQSQRLGQWTERRLSWNAGWGEES